MTVREMLARMDSAEITEWIAYFRLEAEDEMRKQEQADKATQNGSAHLQWRAP